MYSWAANPNKLKRAMSGTEKETLAKYIALGGRVITSNLPVEDSIIEPKDEDTKLIKAPKVKAIK